MGASGPGRPSAGWAGTQPAWDENQPAGWDDNRLTGWDDSEPAGWKNSQLAAWDQSEPEDWNDSLSASGPSRRGRHAGTRSARSRQQRSLRMGRGWAAAAATVTASVLVAAGLVLSSGPASGPGRQAAALAALGPPSTGTPLGPAVCAGE